jgi:hypothetical protein
VNSNSAPNGRWFPIQAASPYLAVDYDLPLKSSGNRGVARSGYLELCAMRQLPALIVGNKGGVIVVGASNPVIARGRGRLPVWVVRILDVLRCMGSLPQSDGPAISPWMAHQP